VSKPEIGEEGIRLNYRLLPIVVALLLVWQLAAPHDTLVALLVGLGGAWLVAYLWARSLRRNVVLRREVRFGWAQVGDQLEERFTVRNDGWAPALVADLIDHSTMPAYRVGRGTAIDGLSTNRWVNKASCSKRGLFTLGPTSLKASDPLGIYTVIVHDPASAPLVVMPPVVPLPAIQVSVGGRAGDGRPRPKGADQTVSAASVREYSPGDSLRWIHWRTTARLGEPYVRLLDGTPAGDWWIALDMDVEAQAGRGEETTDEHGVILAASLADRGLRLGRAVGLIAHGEGLVWLPPRARDSQRWEIMRSLARISTGSCSLSELLGRAGPALGRHASLIVITAAAHGDWVPPLIRLIERDATPTVLLLDPKSYGESGDVRPVAAALAELGVRYYVITREFLTQPEARPGEQGRWEWRVLPTGRAVPVRRPRELAWRGLS
jgi:uncharacterized protein (DUF58 family)